MLSNEHLQYSDQISSGFVRQKRRKKVSSCINQEVASSSAFYIKSNEPTTGFQNIYFSGRLNFPILPVLCSGSLLLDTRLLTVPVLRSVFQLIYQHLQKIEFSNTYWSGSLLLATRALGIFRPGSESTLLFYKDIHVQYSVKLTFTSR
jgi:hypothetical protein